MKDTNKTDVLILTTREGHLSLAQAINEALIHKKIKTEQFFYDDLSGFSAYRLVYIYQPKLFKHIYELGKKEVSTKILDEIYKISVYPVVKKTLDFYKPKVVVSTHFAFTSALHKYCRWHHIKVINIIPNPQNLIPNEIYPQAEINTAFDDVQKKHILSIYPNTNVLETGWFVRERFEKNYDKEKIRKQLKLKIKALTFLFVSGSEGTETIASQLKKLIKNIGPKHPSLQLVVACGNNEFLLNRIQLLAKKISHKDKKIKIMALSFTNDLNLYMQASDLIIGKAGPNTLFEAVATKTPFFATTHIHGLEEGSLEIIKKYNLGFIEENPKKMILELGKIVKNPEILQQFKLSLEEMAQKNKQSKEILLAEINSLIAHCLDIL